MKLRAEREDEGRGWGEKVEREAAKVRKLEDEAARQAEATRQLVASTRTACSTVLRGMLRARRPPRAAVALARWRAAAVAIGARERVREEAEVCARRVAATEQAARMQVVQQAQALQAKLELLSRISQ